MMKTVKGYYYSDDHEWVNVQGDQATVGITDYAQEQLGQIVYVELPEVGAELKAGDVFCVVESVKAASDSLSPVSGTVVESNEELDGSPELLNEDAYGNWIMKIKLTRPDEISSLMDEEAYQKFCEEEEANA